MWNMWDIYYTKYNQAKASSYLSMCMCVQEASEAYIVLYKDTFKTYIDIYQVSKP